MRIATGLLLTLWLLFLGFKFLTTVPIDYDAEIRKNYSGLILFFEVVAWAFVFTKPRIACVILGVSAGFALLASFLVGPYYLLMVLINVVFAMMSYSGYREIRKKEKSQNKKQISN